ncbi:MAG: transketolase [Eggerthellaceae bacterium]|nr:transketolase [Eggerthellaceae bacterium]
MNLEELQSKANDIRIDIVRSVAEAGSGHPGGSLSSADILCALYFGGVLQHDPQNPTSDNRDRFILAKGHAAPALYATLANAAYFPREELLSLRKWGSRLQGHPDCHLLPGVEVSTGSLGQGLSIAAGLACGLRARGNGACVFTLLGDGECEEGQVWEAAMFAAHEACGNLVAIVDSNGLQIDGDVADVVQVGTLAEKFEAFGWHVHEVDGHDIAALIEQLSACKAEGGQQPHAIIAHTTKGKGVSFMEGQAGWHGKAPNKDELAIALADLGLSEEEIEKSLAAVPKLDITDAFNTLITPEENEVNGAATAPQFASEDEKAVKKATRAALGETLIELAGEGLPIAAVDADLAGSTTLGKFGAAYPEAFYNAGIAEQNMVDVAAGLALAGNVAFTGSFAVFGTGRTYDQIRNTVAYSKLNVKICPTHAGVSVGPDGGSHQMLEDVALMRELPHMKILVPADYNAAKSAIRLAAATPGPVYVRMGRANVPTVYAEGAKLEVGRAYVLREGSDVSIIANGVEIREALLAAEELAEKGISAEVIDAFCVKPLDAQTIINSVKKTGRAVVCEEHSIYGGLCSAVAELLAQSYPAPCAFVAIKDIFGKSGSFEELMEQFRLNSAAIVEAVES